MRFINGLTLFFYTLVFLLIGGLFIVMSLNIVSQEYVIDTVGTIYATPNIRLALGITGILLIFISIMVTQITVGKIQREKTIAFENPDGQVTISLTAIEDFIKRAIKQMPEVKELKPNVRASKKGDIVYKECMNEGLLINCTQDTILRIMPPLNVTKTEIDKAISILDKVFAKI